MPSPSTPQLMGILIWCLLLLGALVMLGVALWLGRRWARSGGSDGSGAGEVWTLHKLRELRSSGQLTEAEFEKLRAGVLQAMGGAAKGRAAQSSPPSGNDVKTPAHGGR